MMILNLAVIRRRVLETHWNLICFQLKKKIISEKDCFGKKFDTHAYQWQHTRFRFFYSMFPLACCRAWAMSDKHLVKETPPCSSKYYENIPPVLEFQVGYGYHLSANQNRSYILVGKTDLWWAVSTRNILPLDILKENILLWTYIFLVLS